MEKKIGLAGWVHYRVEMKFTEEKLEKAVGKDEKQNIKNNLITNLKKENVIDDYNKYINKLKEKLNKF